MVLNLQIPEVRNLKPTITVVGVGGAGGNAVNNMIETSVEGVKFVIANTDAQSIESSKCDNKIQLGIDVTQGLGAGSYPEVGKAAAEESMEEVMDHIQGSNMVFITAGMGGGTGTGAAPVIAKLAREQGILTVGVVTKPFHFEGTHRMRVAELGLQELQSYVDTMIVIPNQNLFRVADKNTTFLDAFKMADNVLKSGVKGITDLMVMPGLINLDFSDVRSVMSEMGKAMMGTGEAEGENRSMKAAEAAIANPLLDNVSMQGAKGVLINITGGADMTLFEADEAANRIREEVDDNANIIFGSTFDNGLEGKIRVSVVATGIEGDIPTYKRQEEKQNTQKEKFNSEGAFTVKEEQNSAINTSDETQKSGLGYNQKNNIEAGNETEDEEIEAAGFISKEPIDPTKNAKSQPPQNNSSRGENNFNNRPNRPTPQNQPTSGGLFSSLFSRKADAEDNQKALFTPGDEEQPDQPKISKSKYEEDLDVPAFLRRKSG